MNARLPGVAVVADANPSPQSGEPLALPNPDWLRHHLAVSGPAEAVGRFRAAATGTNAAPWHLDLDAEEERLWAPMAAAGPAARDLARALRSVLAVRHDRVRAGWDGPGTCPLDLHRLVPVPPAVLALGVDDPEARRWLWRHWGTVEPLRDPRVLPGEDKRLRRAARVTYTFLSADWTPWAALRRIRRDWPALIIDVQPQYDRA